MVQEGAGFSSILRARAKITHRFRIPASGHLQPILNHKILDVVLICLRFCSIWST